MGAWALREACQTVEEVYQLDQRIPATTYRAGFNDLLRNIAIGLIQHKSCKEPLMTAREMVVATLSLSRGDPTPSAVILFT